MIATTEVTRPPIDYDPNLTMCGRMAKQTVRLTFGQWRYRGTYDVSVGGNITGLEVIRAAVDNLFESLSTVPIFNDETGENDEMSTISLGRLQCMDDDLRREEWLADMLISAEIIAIEPEAEQ